MLNVIYLLLLLFILPKLVHVLDMFEYKVDDYNYNTRHLKDPKFPDIV